MLRNTNRLSKNISSFSLYDVLGVKQNSTYREIRKSYLEKIKVAHPDLNEGSHKEFISVKEAFETLNNPQSRRKYDQALGVSNPQWKMQTMKSSFVDYDSLAKYLPGRREEMVNEGAPDV